MKRLTYQDVIRSYSRSARDGYSDADLTARERRILHVLLNVASNSGHAATTFYPPMDNVRDTVIKRLQDGLWDFHIRAIVEAASPAMARADGSREWDRAVERALTILQNV